MVAAGEADAEDDNTPSRKSPAASRALERSGFGMAQKVPIKMLLAPEYRRAVMTLQSWCGVCHMWVRGYADC